MRSNQVSISLERFLDKEQMGMKDLHINVYADSNNVYEALASAYFEVLSQIQDEGNVNLPTFGRREHYPARPFGYNQDFEDFINKKDLDDEFRDFREEMHTWQDQFLEKKDLVEEFGLYRVKKMKSLNK